MCMYIYIYIYIGRLGSTRTLNPQVREISSRPSARGFARQQPLACNGVGALGVAGIPPPVLGPMHGQPATSYSNPRQQAVGMGVQGTPALRTVGGGFTGTGGMGVGPQGTSSLRNTGAGLSGSGGSQPGSVQGQAAQAQRLLARVRVAGPPQVNGARGVAPGL